MDIVVKVFFMCMSIMYIGGVSLVALVAGAIVATAVILVIIIVGSIILIRYITLYSML